MLGGRKLILSVKGTNEALLELNTSTVSDINSMQLPISLNVGLLLCTLTDETEETCAEIDDSADIDDLVEGEGVLEIRLAGRFDLIGIKSLLL